MSIENHADDVMVKTAENLAEYGMSDRLIRWRCGVASHFDGEDMTGYNSSFHKRNKAVFIGLMRDMEPDEIKALESDYTGRELLDLLESTMVDVGLVNDDGKPFLDISDAKKIGPVAPLGNAILEVVYDVGIRQTIPHYKNLILSDSRWNGWLEGTVLEGDSE